MHKLFPAKTSGLTVLFLLLFFNLFSQDTSTVTLDEVIITSQRKATKTLSVPYSISIVSQQSLQEIQPRTAPEALMGVNGVFVQKTSHGGGSPFLRGLTGNQTLVLVDGIRMNNATFRYGPNQYFNTIDPYNIQKIEIARGTGSVQYGSDAMGGVIQVFTKEPAFSKEKKRFSANVLGKYMTQDMEKTARAEMNYSSPKLAVQIGSTIRDFGDLVGGDTTGRQSPSGYKEFSYDAKIKWALAKHVNLTVAQQFLRQQDVPVYHKIKLENFAINAFDPQRRLLTYSKLNYRGTKKLIRNLELIASFQQTVEGRISRKNGSNILRREKDDVNTFGFTSDISSEITNSWTANSGIEVYLDKVNSQRHDENTDSKESNMLRGLYPDNSSNRNYSIYSLHHLELRRFLLEGGIRLNTFQVKITDSAVGAVTITPSALVYNGSVMYRLAPSHHLYMSVSTGFRSPNIDDLGTLGIVDFRYEVPVKNLQPEKSRSVELGYKMQNANWSGALSAYHMQLQSLITRVKSDGEFINGYPVYRKENVERGFIRGVEAEVGYSLRFFQFKGSLAYAYGQSTSRNEPLRRIPPLNGRISSAYRKNKFFALAEFLFTSKQDRLAQGDKEDNRIPPGGTPGWNVLNMYSGYRSNHYSVNLGLQNIFNQDYRTHGSGINGVGRSGYISITLSICY